MNPSGKLATSWPRSVGHVGSGSSPFLASIRGKWVANARSSPDPGDVMQPIPSPHNVLHLYVSLSLSVSYIDFRLQMVACTTPTATTPTSRRPFFALGLGSATRHSHSPISLSRSLFLCERYKSKRENDRESVRERERTRCHFIISLALQPTASSDIALEVTFDIENSGEYDGTQVYQVSA